MSDIFREVDEDLRHEQYRKLWDRFGPYILAVAVLIVVGVAGYKLYEYWQKREAQATGDRFVAALRLAAQDKPEEALAALAEIAKDGSGGYPLLASFRAASEKAVAGDAAGAVAEYDTISKSGGTPRLIAELARLRAALLLVDTASLADLEGRVGEFAATGNPWRSSAREILGLAAFRTNDLTAARKYFTDITADDEAPQNVRSRAQFMLGLITARQGEPAKPAEPAAAPAAPAAEPEKPAGG